jgi:hypothetical protein
VLGGQQVASDKTSGRLELANWIASRENPLTARVMVNRLWHHHFGRGIVPTPNDFGKQGKPPSHPELLDWLAIRFMDSGWSLKAMHRLMVTSRAYQMSSNAEFEVRSAESDEVKSSSSPSALRTPHLIDPGNELLWRFNRRRLDAESIRDTLLMQGGNLDPSMGGPHPFPPQQEWDFTQHKPFKAVYDSNRRSVYLMTQRIQRHPLMATFDGPDTGASTGSRVTSTTTLQALYFLNDPFVHEQAERIAGRLLSTRSRDEDRIDLAYELLFGRSPTAEERSLAKRFVHEMAASGEQAAWTSYVRALLRTNEFVYLD